MALDTPGAPLVLLDAFLEEVVLVPAETVDTARIGIRLSAERKEELVGPAHRTPGRVLPVDEDPDGEPWSVFLAIHPDPNRR